MNNVIKLDLPASALSIHGILLTTPNAYLYIFVLIHDFKNTIWRVVNPKLDSSKALTAT